MDPEIISREIAKEAVTAKEQSLALSILLIRIGDYGKITQEACAGIVQGLGA
ncbi:hypothetical protein KBI33_03065 [Candidatus Shapirobacteria bacterium]|nr:hypothetical protein [Candidatus Shapirobacteria bacterium]